MPGIELKYFCFPPFSLGTAPTELSRLQLCDRSWNEVPSPGWPAATSVKFEKPPHSPITFFDRREKDQLLQMVQYSTVQYSAVQYSTIQYNTVQYSTVEYSAVQ